MEDFPWIAVSQQFWWILMRWHPLLLLYIRKLNIQCNTTTTSFTICETVCWSSEEFNVNIGFFFPAQYFHFFCFFDMAEMTIKKPWTFPCIAGETDILLIFWASCYYFPFNSCDHCNHAEGGTCARMPPEPHSGSSCKCHILILSIYTSVLVCWYHSYYCNGIMQMISNV